MLDGPARQHDCLLRQPVLLLDYKLEEQVHVWRVLHLGEIACRLICNILGVRVRRGIDIVATRALLVAELHPYRR